MSIEFSYQLRREEPGIGLREIDEVRLLVDASSPEGVTIPAGAEGTIVTIWGSGDAYEVEFAEPEGALLKLKPGSVAFLGRHAS